MTIIGTNAKTLRYNLAALTGSQANVILPAGEHALVDTTNSMNANGQGVFNAYIVGDGTTKNSAQTVHLVGTEIVYLTQDEFDALPTKDPNIEYRIFEDE